MKRKPKFPPTGPTIRCTFLIPGGKRSPAKQCGARTTEASMKDGYSYCFHHWNEATEAAEAAEKAERSEELRERAEPGEL